jgi:hypothetical protein
MLHAAEVAVGEVAASSPDPEDLRRICEELRGRTATACEGESGRRRSAASRNPPARRRPPDR